MGRSRRLHALQGFKTMTYYAGQHVLVHNRWLGIIVRRTKNDWRVRYDSRVETIPERYIGIQT